MSYMYLSEIKHKRSSLGNISIRQTAKQMRVSYSALARILREDTWKVTTHTDLCIQRWLFPERELPPCSCVRCQEGESSILERLNELDRGIWKMAEILLTVTERVNAHDTTIQTLREQLETHEHLPSSIERSESEG